MGIAVLFFLQDITDTFGGDDLLGGGSQLLQYPLELGVIMGPGKGLQQMDGLRFSPQHRVGTGGVEAAQGGVDLRGNSVLEFPQRLKVQNAAVEPVQKFSTLRGHLFSGAADAGEQYAAAAADFSF